MNPSLHPSFAELDALHLGSANAAVRAHAEHCEACTAHLEQLQMPVAIPAWVHELETAPRFRWPQWLPRLAMGFAMATLLVIVAKVSLPDRELAETGTRPKAALPAIAVHIKRGGKVFVWDGVQTVQPGDMLRLEISADGYQRVRVESPSNGSSVVLFEGALERGKLLVPVSWEVDGKGLNEQLDVTVFGPGKWTRRVTLNKQAAP